MSHERCNHPECKSVMRLRIDGKAYCQYHAQRRLSEAAQAKPAPKPAKAVSKKTLSERVKSALTESDR